MTTYTQAQISEARGWLADCECPADMIAGDGSVVALIEANYVGGWAQFLKDGE